MRIELPEEKKLVHDITLAIRWSDMDAMGHVNNAEYFRYIEVARIEWMRSLGGPPAPSGQGPVVVNSFCNYLRQLVYPGDVRVRTHVSPPGRSSFETWVTMERADEPGALYATGGATVVWLDRTTNRSTALPEWLRARLV